MYGHGVTSPVGVIRQSYLPAGQDPCELLSDLAAIAEQLVGMDADRPGFEGLGERDAVAVDDVGPRRQVAVGEPAGAAPVAEDREPDEPGADQQGDAEKQQQAEHQPMTRQGQHPLALAGKADAVGRRRD